MIGKKKAFYLGSNWKMNKTFQEMEVYLPRYADLAERYPETSFFAIPPYTHLERAGKILNKRKVLLGAQNAHWLPFGPYTGEISMDWLPDLGVKVIELGHSERRSYYQENDWDLNKKVHAAQAHSMTALLCIGENEQEKKFCVTEEILRKQLKIALYQITDCKNLWIAYEPVWSIGDTGSPAEPDYVDWALCVIRDTLSELFGSAANLIPLLYGGSVNPSNCVELAALNEANGLFIGRSAWDITQFKTILDLLNKAGII